MIGLFGEPEGGLAAIVCDTLKNTVRQGTRALLHISEYWGPSSPDPLRPQAVEPEDLNQRLSEPEEPRAFSEEQPLLGSSA